MATTTGTPPPTTCAPGCDGLCDSGAFVDQCGVCVTPNPENVTHLVLTGTIRDFNGSSNRPGQFGNHPDFEGTIGVDRNITTLVLDGDNKPTYGFHPSGTLTTRGENYFKQWYRTVPGVNLAAPISFTLTRLPNGMFRYSNFSFFPIDGKMFGNQGRNHNFHFTIELHTRFTYRGETSEFVGDDDVWVYINGRRVIDLGGVHVAENATVSLDAVASQIGITVGNDYQLLISSTPSVIQPRARLRLPPPSCSIPAPALISAMCAGGDNTTCMGCDGIPNSGKVIDACGVCGGDNSTCDTSRPPIKEVEFCYSYSLKVNKIAEGFYDKLVNWVIEKNAEPSFHQLFAGIKRYEQLHRHCFKGESLQNYHVVGAITVTNPSPLLVTVNITDELSPAQSDPISLVHCANHTIEPYGTVECARSGTSRCRQRRAESRYCYGWRHHPRTAPRHGTSDLCA